jgi:hypothetical protein
MRSEKSSYGRFCADPFQAELAREEHVFPQAEVTKS